MEPDLTIPDWHERILAAALAWRRDHPDFTFNLRTSDPTGKTRLSRGYWFTGTERYLWFSPFKPNDQHNKTKTIGFVINFNRRGLPARLSLRITYDGVNDHTLRLAHQRLVSKLEGLESTSANSKYRRVYQDTDPLSAFGEFLRVDYPRLRELIESEGLGDAFFVAEPDFQEMLQRVNGYRLNAPPPGPEGKPDSDEDEPRNLILYGPPGTGKTYRLTRMFSEYTDTAHNLDREAWIQQLMSEFGWRPVIAAAMSDMDRPARVPEIREHPWVVAKAVERGRDSASVHATVWNFLQEHTPEEVETVRGAVRRPPFIFTKSPDGLWSLLADWAEQAPAAARLRDILRRGPAPGRNEVRRYRVVTFHPSYSYEDFIRGIRPVTDEETSETRFAFVDGVFKQLCDEARANPTKRYALFIDEINRANISKVFGELITLIEPDKRAAYDKGRMVSGVAVQLPGATGADVADEPFSVPANLDIYGTMNTADRSIALLDIALRRRFEFEEMEPDYDELDEPVGDINLGLLLKVINDRLEFLLDRDHRIGHAYLMQATTVDDLRAVFNRQVIPLLQEYFFDDFSRVALVLATVPDAPPFLTEERLHAGRLFPASRSMDLPAERSRFVQTDPATWTEASFLALYAREPVASDI